MARRDVPTCAPGTRVAEARRRAEEAGWTECVVVNGAGVVLGIVRERALGGDANALVDGLNAEKLIPNIRERVVKRKK